MYIIGCKVSVWVINCSTEATPCVMQSGYRVNSTEHRPDYYVMKRGLSSLLHSVNMGQW